MMEVVLKKCAWFIFNLLSVSIFSSYFFPPIYIFEENVKVIFLRGGAALIFPTFKSNGVKRQNPQLKVACSLCTPVVDLSVVQYYCWSVEVHTTSRPLKITGSLQL